MHKNYSQQYDNSPNQDYSFEPVTLSFNKRLLDHKKNEMIFNKSMKKIHKLDSPHSSQQLLCQLYSLLRNEDVRKNMTGGLHQRVEKIFSAAQLHQIKQTPLNNENKTNQFKVEGKNQEIIQNQRNIQNKCQKNKSQKNLLNFQIANLQNLLSQKKAFKQKKQNKQNILHRGTFNLKKESHCKNIKKLKELETQKSQSKQKKQISKKFRSFESQKCLKYVNNSKKVQNRYIGSNQQKQNKKQLKNRTKQRSQQKSIGNTIQRQYSNSKCPYSLNTTVFTTRNCLAQIKNSKRKQQKISSEKKSLVRQTKSKQKSNRMKTEFEQKRTNNIKERKNLTQEQNLYGNQNTIFKDDTCSDQQLFGKQQNDQILDRVEMKEQYKRNKKIYDSPIKSHNILEQTCSFQFIEKIYKLQKSALDQQHQLQTQIKQLKNLISVQKYATQSSKCLIFKLKEQQNNVNINNTFIFNKKKEVHRKLQYLWSEVKALNIKILQIKKQNTEIMGSVEEERQLIQMYTTVIQQLKQQLKIETDERDQFKKKLNQSKKNQMAIKMKATCRKEKTQLIMSNIRESISKWIS